MEFRDLINRARKIKQDYTMLNRTENLKPWQLQEYVQGFMGDVGDLNKLIMAKNGFRFSDTDVDAKLGHELADCLWSIITIADELGIDLEQSFTKTMDDLESKIAERDVK